LFRIGFPHKILTTQGNIRSFLLKKIILFVVAFYMNFAAVMFVTITFSHTLYIIIIIVIIIFISRLPEKHNPIELASGHHKTAKDHKEDCKNHKYKK